jgi:nucleotide-binding universal stress UspA family protein
MSYRILCAYDNSAGAERAFEHALEMARRFEGELHVVAVVEPAEASRGVKAEALLNAAYDQFREAFERLQARATAAGSCLAATVSIGSPATQILKRAEELRVDHLILGQRGKNSFERTTLGSVSLRVTAHSESTVTVVR